jgi:hypothetical protein
VSAGAARRVKEESKCKWQYRRKLPRGSTDAAKGALFTSVA